MQGRYDVWLVLTSVVVASVASFAALSLAARVTSGGRFARLWLAGGAMAMGFGIWSMHFIGMLAFSLPIPLAYDPLLTLASLGIAIATSGIALAVVAQLATVSDEEVDVPILAAGGVVMGAGICGMHYLGMAALRTPVAIPVQQDVDHEDVAYETVAQEALPGLPHPSVPLAPVHEFPMGRRVVARAPAPAGWQHSAVVGLDDDDIGFADIDEYQPRRVANG